METILGNRRSDKRYDLRLPMRYKIFRGRRVLHEGEGYTCNLGRGGVAFQAGRFLPSGLSIEVSIDWPVLLRGHDSIQLRIHGRIARSDGQEAAVKAQSYDFVRTESAASVLHPYADASLPVQPFLTM